MTIQLIAGAGPATSGAGPDTDPAADSAVGRFLTPDRWARANRHVTAKAIAEFAHERIIAPKPLGAGWWSVTSDDGALRYVFEARLGVLDHWRVLPDSIRVEGGVEIADEPAEADAVPDALRFVCSVNRRLGIPAELLPVYLEELTSTLSSACYKAATERHGARELAYGVTGGSDVAADFQAIEAAMTEGHPCFVANNGRLGFGSGDYAAYAPEVAEPVALHWVAAHRDAARFDAVDGFDHRRLLEAELGTQFGEFQGRLRALGLDPEDYLLVPVHPWQWENRLSVTFAADVARRVLVHLGPGRDTYQAQQSIRTFFNRSEPTRCYVKTALSISNMGFLRGLSAHYMQATPAINAWLDGVIRADPLFASVGFGLLRETAAVGVRSALFESATEPGSPYRKMLAGLWRESPLAMIGDAEQLATMASLLHRDSAGTSVVGQLIERSGLPAGDWLARYLRAYLVPLLHSLYAYELAFMPHGENVILVLRDGAPERILMKDIGEEIVVMGDRTAVPEEASRVMADVPEEERVLAIFTDVFDCYFRFLGAVLEEDGILAADGFWDVVADVVHGYQDSQPDLAAQFTRYDLFAEDFALSCLNRLQLRNTRQMLDLSDQSGGLQFSGRLANPLFGR
jgi:siderophore synthetase component